MQIKEALVKHLKQNTKKMSKSHKKIANYIVDNYDKAAFMTSTKLSEVTGVSESTVVRFATALGYLGYPQLQEHLQEILRQELTAYQRLEMVVDTDPEDILFKVLNIDMQNIRMTTEAMDIKIFKQAIDKILSARHIYVIGLRSAAPIAQFFAYYLQYIFNYVKLISSGSTDVFEDVSRINKDDILIGISFPRYSTRTVEAMRFAKNQGIEVIGITDGLSSPLNEVSSLCLTARTDMISFVDSLAAPLSLINGIIIALAIHRKKELSEHLNKLENIWDAYKVYLGKEND